MRILVPMLFFVTGFGSYAEDLVTRCHSTSTSGSYAVDLKTPEHDTTLEYAGLPACNHQRDTYTSSFPGIFCGCEKNEPAVAEALGEITYLLGNQRLEPIETRYYQNCYVATDGDAPTVKRVWAILKKPTDLIACSKHSADAYEKLVELEKLRAGKAERRELENALATVNALNGGAD